MTALLRTYTFSNVRVCNRNGSGAVAFDIKALQVAFDKSWTPYCQATVTVGALTATQVSAMSPLNDQRLRFTLTEVDTGGQQYVTNFDLCLRSREQSWLTGELRLTASSDESLLQDFGYLSAQQPSFAALAGPGSGQFYALDIARSAVLDGLNLVYTPDPSVVQGIVVDSGSPQSLLLDGTDANIDAGATAWDWAVAMAEASGAWLWCDEGGTVRWTSRSYAPVSSSTFTASDADLLIDVTDTVSRDDPSWGNAVVIAYTGNSPTLYLTSSAGVTPRKTITITRNRRRPSNGSALVPRQQAQAHGRSLRLRAAADIRARPNQNWAVSWLGQSATGTVQSVSFDYPSGTMDMLVNI